MNVRDRFAKKRREAMIPTIIGFAMMPLGAFLAVLNTAFVFAVVGGLALFAFGLVYGFSVLRCPKCDGSWRSFAAPGFQPTLDEMVRFCPYCGYAIDMEQSSGEKAVSRQEVDERIMSKPTGISEPVRRFPN